MIHRTISLWFATILLLAGVYGWDIALEITTQASHAYGGEPFQAQPVVTVNNLKGELQSTFDGRVTVQLVENDVKHASLQRNGEVAPMDSAISQDVIDGRAEFSGLSINIAGEGYQLQFTLYDEYDLIMGTAVGDEITVEVGDRFMLDIIAHPESAYGGKAFGSQPVLAIKDRGGNVVSNVNEGSVTVALHDGNEEASLRCSDTDRLTIPIDDGIAKFNNLYINKAGTDYSLQFSTDLTLDGPTEIVSNIFSVGVGPAAYIVLVRDASDGTVYGGKAFTPQPRAEVRDEGGNLVTTDSSSAIRVSFYSNPSGGLLSSIHGTTGYLQLGIVQFRGLAIDKAGQDYRLVYTFFKHEDDELKPTSIATLGMPFNVEVGSTYSLSILRHSSRSWAGNQPFLLQPKIGLVDAGGNIVVQDSSSIVTAEVTPSISHSSFIIVDTSDDPVPEIARVSFTQNIILDDRTLYGPGDVIGIIVSFTQEVALYENGDTLPKLILNANLDEDVYAELANSPEEGLLTDELFFEYAVDGGDSQIELNYQSIDAFQSGDYLIEDAFGRKAQLSLPPQSSESSLSSSKSIGISDSPPSIISIAVDLPVGGYELGAGHVVEFIAMFDREVQVRGIPELPLQIESTIAIIDTITSEGINGGSYFTVTYRGVESEPISWNASALDVTRTIESMDSMLGDVCVARDLSPNAVNAGGYRWAIRLENIDDDVSQLGIDGAGMQFTNGGDLQVQLRSTGGILDGWHPDDGNSDMCTARSATYLGGSGSKTLRFRFQVLRGDSSENFGVDVKSNLILSGLDNVSLLVNRPDQSPVDADLRLETASLNPGHGITINTERPKVMSIIPRPIAASDGMYSVGDALYFEVTFDAPVAVDIGLELKLNAGDGAVARYFSGSGTDTLLLEYLVQEGEAVDQLDFMDSYSLVAENTEGGRVPKAGYVRRISTLPSTDADLNLLGVERLSVHYNIEIDGSKPTLISVSVLEGDEGKSLGRGDTFNIVVQFSSGVEVDMDNPPLLGLLVGTNMRWAAYLSGDGSPTLIFSYTVLLGDTCSPLDLKYTTICRNDDCNDLDGLIMRQSAFSILDADLKQGFSNQGIAIASVPDRGVYIDTSLSSTTTVDSIRTALGAGVYSPGTIIEIDIIFTDAVFVSGLPALSLNTNSDAVYSSGNGTNIISFQYVTEGDRVSELDWALDDSTDSPVVCVGGCSIVNGNGVDIDVRFVGGIRDIEPLSPTIALDPSPPRVVSIHSDKGVSPYCHPLCAYTAGEEIAISVTFDRPVVTQGTDIFLALDVGDDSDGRKAVFDPQRSSENTLVLVYTVLRGHSSGSNLNYVCEPLQCGIELGAGVAIKAATNIPTIDANLSLPFPTALGFAGSEAYPIIVDARNQPQVVAVTSTNLNGTYSPGDIIEIVVEFSKTVIVTGEPYLLLDIGSDDGIATYQHGSGSSNLVFEYVVGLNHSTFDLDYRDAHSLYVGNNGVHPGSIKQASSRPIIDAIIDLPFPSSTGSLGHSSDIVIDSREPYITSVSAITSDSLSVCNTGDTVLIHIQFSRPVTVHGNPTLKLETGIVDRHAEYESQLDDKILQFKYTAKLGDISARLDYWSDEKLLPSSVASLQLNGGWIRTSSANPSLDADLHLNPVGGYLDGNKIWILNEGIASFHDLKVGRRGKDYKVRYSSSVPKGVVEAQEMIEVGISIEYEVQGHLGKREPGDSYGHAVAIRNDLVAVGAPRKRNPRHEVQVLTVYSEAFADEHEVQLITTSINRQDSVMSVQEFSTCADPGETINGTFELAYKVDESYAFASDTIKLDASATAEKIKTTLESELGLVGLVAASRSANFACESSNSWTWVVTFFDSSNTNGILETNGEGLIGSGVQITPPTITRHMNMLSGSFQITNPSNNKVSRLIPYDASAMLLKEALEEDLGIVVKTVQVENTDLINKIPELGRRWIIFFSHHFSDFGFDVNIPQLQLSGDGLGGSGAHVWSYTSFEGRGILGGNFAVSFRGSQFSHFVSHDSSEEELAAALESLDSINEIRVTDKREFINEARKSGVSWTITFVSVNKLTDYGWLVDQDGNSCNGNLPAIEINSHLIGWNYGYKVENESGTGREDTQAQWMKQHMGDNGLDSGAVDIFHRVGEIWTREETLIASDYDSNDLFGTALSLTDDYLLVGAPFKQVNGFPERQVVTCNGPATDGFFVLGFRGFQSSAIPYDATLEKMKSLIIGTYGETAQLHSLPRLIFSIDPNQWDGSSRGFCSGSEASVSITFLTPDAGGISTAKRNSGDIEDIAIVSQNLTGALLSISDARVGTKAPMGKDVNLEHATGKQSGSAYIYKRSVECLTCTPSWTEIKKITPLDGHDDATDAALFGWSSVFVPATDTRNALAIIGSPGFDQNAGKVYIFEQVGNDWVILDTLTDQNWNDDKIKGGRFGSSLDADQDSILVGCPHNSNGRGAVYVFRRSQNQRLFLASQEIIPNDLEQDEQFGHSISLSNNKATICAPYKSILSAVHVYPSKQKARNAGACYVYHREDQIDAFQLEQKLVSSNILAGDRFGWDVSMDGNKIIVGQMEDFKDRLSPPRPVQKMKIYCEEPPCSHPSFSLFRLNWKKGEQNMSTPFLAVNTSANQLRDSIENNLFSGEIAVSRSALPDGNGGYTWIITFNSYEPFYKEGNKIPVLDCEMSPKSSLSCIVSVENDISQNIRSKTHIFEFDETNKIWTEQAFLFPAMPQRQDLMGASVAIGGNYAVVGAPNRHLVNVNSGAALVYDTTFLNLNFVDGPFEVAEGNTLEVEVTRSSSDKIQLISLRTLDRNGEDELQHYINEIYSLRSLELTPYDKTAVDLLTATTALGRSQFYGSDERRSLFINGQYDFQGINDYELLTYEGQYHPREHSIIVSLKTNDDFILEPTENVTIYINLRGMFASRLGRLHTAIPIADDQDSKNSAGELCYQILAGIDNHEDFSRLGYGVSVDFDVRANFAVVGSDQTSGVDANGNPVSHIGSVHIFEKNNDGWMLVQSMLPPTSDITPNMDFGHSIAINTPYGRYDTTVLIGAPGAATAYVFSLQQDTNSWVQQGRLSVDEAKLPEHRFGEAVALCEDMLFVGAPGLETVYAFRRSFVAGQGFVEWNLYSTLRSSDYDFDVYSRNFTVKHLHRQSFGVALAASHRSLLVGAPFADYGNRGDVNLREFFRTDGVHNQGLGKGKVYAFYSHPHIQIVKLSSDEIIASGSFRLKLRNHLGIEEEFSPLIQHDSSSDAFEEALESMRNIGEVKVQRGQMFLDKSYVISWRITFLSSFDDVHPLLVPHSTDNGCEDCVEFRVSVLSTVKPFLKVAAIQSNQPYIQEAEIQPRDVTSTDMFGSSMDLDGPQAIIGSKHSAAKTRTTWDFETGDLVGWSTEGNAFEFQPTYGDNSRHRTVYNGYGAASSHSGGEPQSSRLIGRYYIGTFEKRPGDKGESYQEPSKLYAIGSSQGDEPTGTLTSDPFIVLGDTIYFMIGGGCNYQTVYVELLVDGISALRATGKCHEQMEEAQFNVKDFISRSAQIRIVDADSSKWGHINVDHIRFSWKIGATRTCLGNNWGECTEGGGALPKLSPSEKQHYTGKEESARSGAAYMYYRECPDLADLNDLPPNCTWVAQERLVASDKRAGNSFGISVSVDDTQGVAIVGSSNSPAYGFYQEPVYVYPHSNLTTFDFPVPENLSHIIKSASTYSTTGGSIRVMDYLARINNIPVKELSKFTEQAGVAYAFLREPPAYDPNRDIARNAYWRTTEHAKIAPPNVAAGDHFGYSVACRSSTAIMGALGQHGRFKKEGSAFAYDMQWVRVKFSNVEYIAVEGTDHEIKIFLQRDLAWSNSTFSIHYSTSDLSAIGVDTYKYEKCLQLHASERDGCGDYEQAAGEVRFDEGEEFTYFTVRIMDDLCTERNMEFVQLNLHQFGGSPIRGENYRAQLRIDDNDWERDPLSMECNGGIR